MNKEDRLLHLLVIEDNSGDLLLIEDFLFEKIRSPFIQEARSLQEARYFLEKGDQYDAILLDLSLPDRSGESLLEEVLSICRSIPVIVLTGYSDIAFGIRSLSLGVADYLLKDELTAVSLYKSIVYSIERKEITSHLKASESRYRDLFHLSPQPMWLYGIEDGGFLDVNKAAIQHYGYSREEFLTMSVVDIFSSDEKMADKSFDFSKECSRKVIKHQKKDGEIIKVEIKSNTVDFEGRKARVVLANDITQRINYISDIEEKNLRLQEIAWIQSHVVRAPLARLMGLVNAVNDGEEDELDRKKLEHLIIKSAYELDGIIREIAEKADKIRIDESAREKFEKKR